LGDLVKGYGMAESSEGSGKRPYLFEARWAKGKPIVKVSTADVSNKNSFDNRDGPTKPIRELKGMPLKHRPEIRDYAKRVAEHVRSRVFEEHDWLRDQFASSAIPIGVDAQTPLRFAFLQGWLLVEKTTPRGITVSAHFLAVEATPSTAKRAAQRFVASKGAGNWRQADSGP
jgi:hypothetical protein